MRLFMIGMGGSTETSTIEVHDVQFVVAETFEDTFEVVKSRWYGTLDSLHIDSYKVLTCIDGYRIDLEKSSDLKLYFVNYGGYAPSIFGELHAVTFVLANNISEARTLAKKKIALFKHMDHIDEITEVNSNIGLNQDLGFEPSNISFDESPDWQGYIKLK